MCYFPFPLMLFAVCLMHYASALAVRDTQLSPLMLGSGGRRAVTNGNAVFTLTSNGIVENESNVRISGLSLTPTHLILALLVIFNKYHCQRPQYGEFLVQQAARQALLDVIEHKSGKPPSQSVLQEIPAQPNPSDTDIINKSYSGSGFGFEFDGGFGFDSLT
ncbi:hypothetical protein DFH08DRAFT_826524 [Mycena albidolilacea]|uniref:Uncharacterized protein n=1 Tax=Mycena albidolilacea TaxID=1033008 RepID=A0AAD7E929_9AGAR|nr:hypothetical protein DFH08DRAFT_826524 [Mycena albidolilacea]